MQHYLSLKTFGRPDFLSFKIADRSRKCARGVYLMSNIPELYQAKKPNLNNSALKFKSVSA